MSKPKSSQQPIRTKGNIKGANEISNKNQVSAQSAGKREWPSAIDFTFESDWSRKCASFLDNSESDTKQTKPTPDCSPQSIEYFSLTRSQRGLKVKKSKKPGNVREARENAIDEDSMSPCMFLNCDPKSFFLLPRIVIDGVNLPSSPNKDSPSGLENSSFGFGSQRLPSTRDHIPIEQFQPMILYRIQQWSWIKNKHEIWVLSSVKLNQTFLWLLNKLNLKDVGPKSVSEQLLTYPSPDSKLTLTCY